MLTCTFCPLPSVATCMWPVERWVDVSLADLGDGDAVVSRYKQVRGVVIAVDDRVRIRWDQAWAEPGGEPRREFSYPRGDVTVATIRSVACGKHACDLHHCDRGDVHYCADHWGLSENPEPAQNRKLNGMLTEQKFYRRMAEQERRVNG